MSVACPLYVTSSMIGPGLRAPVKCCIVIRLGIDLFPIFPIRWPFCPAGMAGPLSLCLPSGPLTKRTTHHAPHILGSLSPIGPSRCPRAVPLTFCGVSTMRIDSKVVVLAADMHRLVPYGCCPSSSAVAGRNGHSVARTVFFRCETRTGPVCPVNPTGWRMPH